MLRLILTCCVATAFVTAAYAQPANDSCQNAITIMIDEVVDFTTVGATADILNHPGCFGDNDSIVADVWYLYVADSTTVLRWTNCGTADYDSRMAVYQVDDPCMASDDNLVQCNDDGPAACASEFFTSQMDFVVEEGLTYALRLGGFATDTSFAEGSGTVVLQDISASLPPNDFCAQAIAIDTGRMQAFSNLNGLIDGPSHPDDDACFGFNFETINADIWYTFTPTFTGTVEWSTCDIASFDTRMAIYNPGSACPPLTEDLYACNDDGSGCMDFTSRLIFDVEAGQTYILRLGGFATDSGDGFFDLFATEPPIPPANDDCMNAEPTFLMTEEAADAFDDAQFGTTINGTFDQDNFQFPYCLGNQNGGEFATVWYTVETLGNTELQLRLFPAGQGEVVAENFFLDLFSDCNTRVDSSMVSNSCTFTDEDVPFGQVDVTGLPAENITLYVRVTTRLTTEIPGEFGFQLVADVISSVTETPVAQDVQLFPNPVNDRATVRFTLEESAQLEATVLDMLGRRVQQIDLGLLPTGSQQFDFATDHLPAGIYSLQLSNGTARQQMKFVVN